MRQSQPALNGVQESPSHCAHKLLTVVITASILLMLGCSEKPDNSSNKTFDESVTTSVNSESNISNANQSIAPVETQIATSDNLTTNQTQSIQKPLSATGSNLKATGSSLSGLQSDFNIEFNLSSDVLFDFGKADLKPEADASLQEIADVIIQKGKGNTTIIGHTDSIGDEAANQKLSLARAQAVKDWLLSNGVTEPLVVDGLGESDPIANSVHPDGSDNPEGRAKNRRVDIVVNKTTTLAEVSS